MTAKKANLELAQASRKRKCHKCNRTIVKGEYFIKDRNKACCIDCALSVVTNSELKAKIERLRKGQILAWIGTG